MIASRKRWQKRWRAVRACLPIILSCQGGLLRAEGLLEPTLPDDYNQQRNLSITERPRPGYDPLGHRIGGFLAYPALALSIAGTDNAYVTSEGRKGDMYGRIAPSLELRSDWNRHMLDLSAQGVITRYSHQQPLDRDTWDVDATSRIDVGDFTDIAVRGRASKLQEDPFTSQADASLAILSSYRRDDLSVRAEREVGRTRFAASVEATKLRFGDVTLTDIETLSQATRDRSMVAGSAQGEYALSPGAVLLARVVYTSTNYQRLLADGSPNRDAGTWQVLGGLNLDLPDFMRGTIQLGYTRKNYQASSYASVGGISGAVKLEYFLSDLMNFEIDAHRSIEDSATSDNNPYFETMASFGMTRSLQENLLAGLKVGAGNQAYLGSPIRYDIVQASAYVRYLLSRTVSMRLDAGYGKRVQAGTRPRSRIDQSTIMMTMELHR